MKMRLESNKNSENIIFDKDKFLGNFKIKLEHANSKDEIIHLVMEINKEQRTRKDLGLLFDNYKFTNNNGQEISIEDYFDEKIKEFEENLNNPESIEQLKNISLDDLKKELSNSLDDLVVPTLQIEESPEYVKMIKKIEAKLTVKDFQIDDFVHFLNKYNTLSKGIENAFEKFIFEDSPDFYNAKANIKKISDSQEILNRIKILDQEDLLKDHILSQRLRKELIMIPSEEIIFYINKLKELPEDCMDFYITYLSHIYNNNYTQQGLIYSINNVLRNKENFLKLSKFYTSNSDAEEIIFDILELSTNNNLSSVSKNLEIIDKDPKKYFLENKNPYAFFVDFNKCKDLLDKKGQHFEKEDLDLIFNKILENQPKLFFKENDFPFSVEQQKVVDFLFKNKWTLEFDSITKNLKDFKISPNKYFIEKPNITFINYKEIKKYFTENNQSFTQEEVDLIFNDILKNQPELFFKENDFPFSPEQQKIIDIFTKINNSPSSEMKNMALELSLQIVQGGDFSLIDEHYEKIDNIFVKNNIPFVGKQAKICEVLHPHINTSNKSSPELQSLHSDNAKRLLIFKDLMKANFNSLNSNLEQYLLILKNGQEVLNKYEKGEQLSINEEEKLKHFFKKINTLSQNTRKTDKFNKFDLENLSLSDNLQALKSNFGVKENQTITEKFEMTFLRRIDIDNLSEALKYYDNLSHTVTERNKQLALDGQISLGENDLAKGVSINYFDSYLDRGVYAPEFIGAESIEAKSKSKGSDSTPWDTDLIKIGNRTPTEIVEKSLSSGFGEVILIIKDHGQFNKNEMGQPLGTNQNKLELFKNGFYFEEDTYGIRTGFGSTEIDALLVKDTISQNNKQLDFLKFSIAQKGFYIPICDKTGKVIYTANDFEEYKKIFDGVDKYHGNEININEEWKQSKFNETIKEFTQTNENLEKINKIKDDIYTDIENDLKTFGIDLHKGRYDDSVAGAKIIDTGSTGRGSALDTGYDFDFVIKIDDRDADKINQMAENLKKKYPYDQDYESSGMRTFRFKSFEKDGNLIDLDISFVKKSDSEELDANEAVAQKYDSIKRSFGEDKLLDVLTNVRFAKKELKKAGCYKKGLTGNGEQQGGLGGIGVENWILKNGGDAVVAFREFNKNVYQNGELISFNDFKNKYKIFSAGSNIRGGIKAENFVYNMDEVGYQKMAELSKKFIV